MNSIKTREDIDEKLLLNQEGFQIVFDTLWHNSGLHYHYAMEMLYLLNGSASVQMGKRRILLEAGQFLVIDSRIPHEVLYRRQTMAVRVHILKTCMRKYIPGIELLRFQCCSKERIEENAASYERLTQIMREVTVLYMEDSLSYAIRTKGLMMQLLAELVEHFSAPASRELSVKDIRRMERLDDICHYVEENHRKKITLQDAADKICLNREYFCRYFKENLGITFGKYVTNVRLQFVYQDLLCGNESVQEILERHGFHNQKLFYRQFREKYGCTPSELRKIPDEKLGLKSLEHN